MNITKQSTTVWVSVLGWIGAFAAIGSLFAVQAGSESTKALLGWAWLIPVSSILGWGTNERIRAHALGRLCAAGMKAIAGLAIGGLFWCLVAVATSDAPMVSPKLGWAVFLVVFLGLFSIGFRHRQPLGNED